MLDKFNLGTQVIGSFVLAAVLVSAVGGLGYYNAMQGQASDITLIVTAAAAVVVLMWGVVLARSITVPLSLIVRMSQQMGQRHLGMRLRLGRHDEFGMVANELNQLADSLQQDVVGPMRKIAHGDLGVEVQPRDSQDEIALAMKQTVESLRGLASETDVLSRSVSKGRLTTRANPDLFPGAYKVIIQQVNQTLDSVTRPLDTIRQHASQLAAGDAPSQMPELGQGHWDELRNDLNACAGTIRALTSDSIILSQAAAEGRPATRVDANRYRGNFRTIVQNMNSMLEGLTVPLNKSAECLASLAAGDVPPAIMETFSGDLDVMRRDLNQIIETAHMRETDSQLLIQAATEMHWGIRADTSKYSGANGSLMEAVNRMMDALTQPWSVMAECIAGLARGEIPSEITDTYKGNLEKLRNDLNTCINAMHAMSADTDTLSRAAIEGKLAIRADTSKHHGEFLKIVQNVNNMLDAANDPLKLASAYAGRIASGEILPPITEDFQGDWARLRDSLNALTSAISTLLTDMSMLSQAMAEGRLAVRADTGRHQGRFRLVIQNANDALGIMMEAVNDAGQVLTQLADGNLSAQMEGHYEGDFALLKTRVDAMKSGLKNMAMRTQQASFGMSEATAQILASSSQMAMAARRQAGAVIQVAGTVQEAKPSAAQSMQQAQEMARVINELASVVEASAQAAQKIVSEAELETFKLEQISTGIDDVNQTVQNALETAQQWQDMAQNLMVLSEQLKVTAAHYRM